MAITISDVKIANLALSNVGSSTQIEAFGENTPAGRATSLWYDFSRVQTLEAYDWPFARTREALSLHSSAAPQPDWNYRYVYPANSIKIRRLVNPLGKSADLVPYEIELVSTLLEKTILTNVDEAIAVFTADVPDPNLYSVFFTQALSFVLASNIAYAITGKLSLREKMLEQAAVIMAQAEAVEGNEEKEEPERDAIWVRAGGYGTQTVG